MASSVRICHEIVLFSTMCLPPTGELSKLLLEVVVSLLLQDGSVITVGVASAGVWLHQSPQY